MFNFISVKRGSQNAKSNIGRIMFQGNQGLGGHALRERGTKYNTCVRADDGCQILMAILKGLFAMYNRQMFDRVDMDENSRRRRNYSSRSKSKFCRVQRNIVE
jgi:hypothetical protein